MKNLNRILPVALALLFVSTPALAQDGASAAGYIGLGAGVAIGFAALGGGIGQGTAARGMYESVSRNPQAAGKLNAPFYVGMAFIESLVIFAFVIAFQLLGNIG
jgi:F-type H+-transporting ATPase subunit c